MEWETMWNFETEKFAIRWQIAPCEDLDLSWDETGETLENLKTGFWFAFDSRVMVYANGVLVGDAYLSQNIYEDPADFRDHIGMNAKGYGSYFSSMVREAIQETRKTLGELPVMRRAT